MGFTATLPGGIGAGTMPAATTVATAAATDGGEPFWSGLRMARRLLLYTGAGGRRTGAGDGATGTGNGAGAVGTVSAPDLRSSVIAASLRIRGGRGKGGWEGGRAGGLE